MKEKKKMQQIKKERKKERMKKKENRESENVIYIYIERKRKQCDSCWGFIRLKDHIEFPKIQRGFAKER